MTLNLDVFTEPVRGILREYPAGVASLTRSGTCKAKDAAMIQASGASLLFPGARAPEAALSGLLLLMGCWEESHKVSQEVSSREGSYWHAIAHRMEPDSSNCAYWFRRVGEHAIFPELHGRAAEILEHADVGDWRLRRLWDPFLFIEWCDEARQTPGTEKERAALEMQRAEWYLLLEWCASKPVVAI